MTFSMRMWYEFYWIIVWKPSLFLSYWFVRGRQRYGHRVGRSLHLFVQVHLDYSKNLRDPRSIMRAPKPVRFFHLRG